MAGSATAATSRFARLGSFEGQVEVQFDAADSWRPATLNLPLTEATRIRTGAGATVEIELDDTSAFRMAGEGLAELSDYTRLSGGQRITVISLDHGLGYFTGEPGQGNAIDLLLPGIQVALREGSRIRLQAVTDASEIAIIEGAVQFTIPSAEMELHQGQAARVTLPDASRFSLFREIVPLEPDHWSEELDRVEADAPASALDLDRAGKWIKAGDYGTVWQPTPQAGWAPFRDGRWVWFQSIGFTWVGAESWGWKPYHQGRWLQHQDLGWVWVPPVNEDDAAFLPGEVFWARAPNLAAWGALAPGEQWNGAGPPRQYAAFNITGGAFVVGTREIVPSSLQDLPKDLLKAVSFTAALPSPPLPVARLTAIRDPLRTRQFSAVAVAPELQPVTQAAPAPSTEETPPMVAEAGPPPAPIQNSEPETAVPYAPPAPIVPGIVVITAPAPKGAASKTAAKTTPTTYVVPVVPNPVPLNGTGGRESKDLYQRWFQEFGSGGINFQAVATHQALTQLSHGTTDFMVADAPLTDAQISETKVQLFHFPAAITAAVPIYNVPGIYDGLKLTPEAIAGIWLGEIRYWDDRRITSVNPRASLPHLPIILENRSDSGATTRTWNDYLSKIAPGRKSQPLGGLGSNGEAVVAELVRQTPYSLSYVDYAWAVRNGVIFAAVRNHAGTFVQAAPDSLRQAAASVFQNATDLRTSITDAPGNGAYPIASFTYLIVPQKIADQQKRRELRAFLNWMTGAGQNDVPASGYAQLPAEVVSKEQRQVSLMKQP
jgi:phosphate transport system substrate-binding protein